MPPTADTPPRLDPDSLERLVPAAVEAGDATGSATLALHLERYEFAARRARPGRALDLACGVGYGTRLLTDRNPAIDSALGIDLSDAAIAYAQAHYANERTRFARGDAMTFEDPEGFDTIVSIETIEHLPDPARFVARLAGLLRSGGVLIASVPVTPSVDGNPHHLHDFTAGSFRRLFARHGLVERDAFPQVQPFRPWALVRHDERRMQEVRRNLPAYYLRHPEALVRRVWSTLRHGFTNRYLTAVWERPA